MSGPQRAGLGVANRASSFVAGLVLGVVVTLAIGLVVVPRWAVPAIGDAGAPMSASEWPSVEPPAGSQWPTNAPQPSGPPEPWSSFGGGAIQIYKMYSPVQIDATHISVVVDYHYGFGGQPPTNATPLMLTLEGCSDPNFRGVGAKAVQAGDHTVAVVIQALGPFPPADSAGPGRIICSGVAAQIDRETGFDWEFIGQSSLDFRSIFTN